MSTFIWLRKAAALGVIVLVSIYSSVKSRAVGSFDQAAAAENIVALRTQIADAFKAKDEAHAEKLLDALMTIAGANHLGGDASFNESLYLIFQVRDADRKLGYVERALRIVTQDNPQADVRSLCGQMLPVEVTLLMKRTDGMAGLEEVKKRFPACAQIIAYQTPGLTAVIQKFQGNYNGTLSMVIQRWEESRRTGVKPDTAMVPAIVLFSMLSGNIADAKKYLPFLEDDYLSYDHEEKLSLPGLPELRQFEKVDAGTGYAAISVAASFQLNFARDDNDVKRTAMQLVLSAKSTGIDDAQKSVDSLRDSGAAKDSGLAQKVIEEYGSSANLWVKINLLRQSVSTQQEQDAIARMRDLENQLREQNSSGAGVPKRGPRVAEVQAQLGPDDALIEFCQVIWIDYPPGTRPIDFHTRPPQAHYVAYVLRKNGSIFAVDLGEADPINKEIQAYRSFMRPGATGDGWREPAHKLYDQLWKPLEAALPKPGSSAGHIYLSPDSALTLLPFDGLLNEADTFLIKQWDISYLASGRQLMELHEKRRHGTGTVVFADQPPEQSPEQLNAEVARSAQQARGGSLLSREYAPLPSTGREAAAIQKLVPNAVLDTGPGATKAALKSVSSPQVLHIATHGYYLNSADPIPDKTSSTDVPKKQKYGFLRSGIILSKGDGASDEDRVMTSLEIALLNLKDTDLVVLSACDSGVGDTTAGDTVGGLRSAFQMAGAKAVVSSLWTVNDEKGEALMQEFYSNMAAKKRSMTINQSLRQAKLAMVDKQHPYYWASFVLDGINDDLSIGNDRR